MTSRLAFKNPLSGYALAYSKQSSPPPAALRLIRHPPSPPSRPLHLLSHGPQPRSYSTTPSSSTTPLSGTAKKTVKSPHWTKLAIGGSVALAVASTTLHQLSKAPQLEPAFHLSGSMSSTAQGSDNNVVVDLKNEHSRIGVEKKSTSDLLLSFGESAEDCIGTMNLLKGAGINSILDLSVEADLNEEELAKKSPTEVRARFNESADQVADQISTCIRTASSMSKSFTAIKITAMGSPLLLQQISSTLSALEQQFKHMDTNKDGKITKEEFLQLVKLLPAAPVSGQDASPSEMVEQLFKEADKDQDGLVNWVDFASTISLNRDETRALFKKESDGSSATIPGLEQEDLQDYKQVLVRMEKLCTQAQKTHTRLMIDAEQSYFQPAIDSVALHLMENYNNGHHVEGPLIFNTYQMYLKDALGRLERDFDRAQRQGYTLAAKLVRGAYMVSERKRASELGLDDPICNDIEATHRSYNAGVDFMLKEMIQFQETQNRVQGEGSTDQESISLKSSPVVLFVASHNKDSVIRTCERMKDLELSPQSGLVIFGQLMGMCDQISYTLGQHGYGIFKYVPYGPIHHVIPYLIRRAQENASVLGGVAIERQLIWEELKSRFTSSPKDSNSHRPQIMPVQAPVVPGPTTTM
ncbi:hypothetical protein BGW38_006854 [Lunasporangiospora selenospora]|uniref:Proline dehydrogenase n=1 Tax=Lunasporangiospora selenospora TaxID=979761 RepID=A0A9P6FZJ9_9FUNG|nr:hypothetical protein BGW38_006854 [Lunasporangiospora selenospora]